MGAAAASAWDLLRRTRPYGLGIDVCCWSREREKTNVADAINATARTVWTMRTVSNVDGRERERRPMSRMPLTPPPERSGRCGQCQMLMVAREREDQCRGCH